MKICNYNPLVDCKDDTGCVRCGWNPGVEAMRKAKLRKDRAPKELKIQFDQNSVPTVNPISRFFSCYPM